MSYVCIGSTKLWIVRGSQESTYHKEADDGRHEQEFHAVRSVQVAKRTPRSQERGPAASGTRARLHVFRLRRFFFVRNETQRTRMRDSETERDLPCLIFFFIPPWHSFTSRRNPIHPTLVEGKPSPFCTDATLPFGFPTVSSQERSIPYGWIHEGCRKRITKATTCLVPYHFVLSSKNFHWILFFH